MTHELTTIKAMQEEVFAWAESKGWNNPGPMFGEAIALIHSEASEALEEFRVNETFAYVLNADGECATQVDGAAYGDAKPLGVPSEFADILIRLLHYSELFGVDLGAEYTAKMKYNHTRAYRHGGRAL
jgi:NTP pyrophosphatase (non-canonical NTP hydrolase)